MYEIPNPLLAVLPVSVVDDIWNYRTCVHKLIKFWLFSWSPCNHHDHVLLTQRFLNGISFMNLTQSVMVKYPCHYHRVTFHISITCIVLCKTVRGCGWSSFFTIMWHHVYTIFIFNTSRYLGLSQRYIDSTIHQIKSKIIFQSRCPLLK